MECTVLAKENKGSPRKKHAADEGLLGLALASRKSVVRCRKVHSYAGGNVETSQD